MARVDIEYVQLRFLTDYTGALLKSKQNCSLPRDRVISAQKVRNLLKPFCIQAVQDTT
jgi:hypothetical protein